MVDGRVVDGLGGVIFDRSAVHFGNQIVLCCAFVEDERGVLKHVNRPAAALNVAAESARLDGNGRAAPAASGVGRHIVMKRAAGDLGHGL